MKILAIYGTRPEYLKLKSIIEKTSLIKTCFIKQHTDIINFGQSHFSIEINNNCQNRLNSIFSEIFLKLEKIILEFDAILIQGDTATVAASSLVAFHLKKKIIYLEAGLRTYNLSHPYPEEGYRQMISRIADINLCPTKLSAKNLKKEKINSKIYIVGNTSLDNIVKFKNKTFYYNKVLITLHRTENIPIIKDWINCIERFASKNQDLEFIFPVHPNPKIKEACNDCRFIKIINPLQHIDLINLLKDCKFVITDSGGIQEEACFLNKKVIVCRKNTERPEGIDSGHIILCEDPEKIEIICENIKKEYIILSKCPYGDGKSAKRILKLLNIT